ncbi:MAG: 30S ribosomal protein S16, partial [Verrucomicrobiaceae bacterium]|nr:30S ribosomal protein S16 [Verrucomicrobiaceae bacterium]
MAVVLRLRKEGAKHRPVFRIVAADKRFPKEGR